MFSSNNVPCTAYCTWETICLYAFLSRYYVFPLKNCFLGWHMVFRVCANHNKCLTSITKLPFIPRSGLWYTEWSSTSITIFLLKWWYKSQHLTILDLYAFPAHMCVHVEHLPLLACVAICVVVSDLSPWHDIVQPYSDNQPVFRFAPIFSRPLSLPMDPCSFKTVSRRVCG